MHAMFSFSRFIHIGLTLHIFIFYSWKNKLTDLDTKEQQKKAQKPQQTRFKLS